MIRPYETPEFVNAAEFTVAITFRVRGGARSATAQRRARRIAERLADRAARTNEVVAVTATGGLSWNGVPVSSTPIRFTAANSGWPDLTDPDRLDRYVDLEHDRAVASLAHDNAAAEARRQTDRQRRQDVSCANTYWTDGLPPTDCACVYCAPELHGGPGTRCGRTGPPAAGRCLCGRRVPDVGGRCARHVDVDLVVLEHDPAPLRRLAHQHGCDTPAPPGRDLDGPDLSPPGR